MSIRSSWLMFRSSIFYNYVLYVLLIFCLFFYWFLELSYQSIKIIKNVLSSSSGVQKSEIKVLEEFFFFVFSGCFEGEIAPSLSFWWLPAIHGVPCRHSDLCLHLHTAFCTVCVSQCKDISHCMQNLLQMQADLLSRHELQLPLQKPLFQVK